MREQTTERRRKNSLKRNTELLMGKKLKDISRSESGMKKVSFHYSMIIFFLFVSVLFLLFIMTLLVFFLKYGYTFSCFTLSIHFL